jgi:hypothetical protein
VGVSALINNERKRQVLMVSYFTAGTEWVAKKGATVQVDGINARNTKCATANRPTIDIQQYQAQSDATTAVVSGKVDAMLAARFRHMVVTNGRFQWSFILDNAFRPPVIAGVRGTILLTVCSMLIGVSLGVALTIMRLSPNPVLAWLAWVST